MIIGMIMRENVNEIAKSGVVLTVFLTALGYLISYFYSFGYLSYFKIPATFISLSLSSLVFSIAITVFVGLATFYYLVRYLKYEKRHRGKKRLIFLRAIWVTGIALITLSALGLLKLGIVLLITASVIFVIIILVTYHAIKQRSVVRGWAEYWRLLREGIKNDDQIFDLLPGRVAGYLSVAILAVAAAFVIGGTCARSQNEYPLLSSQGEIRTLIVSKNDSELITKNFNVHSKTFEDDYSIEMISGVTHIEQFKLHEPKYSFYDLVQKAF